VPQRTQANTELFVAGAALARDMPVDLDVVGRIGDDHGGLLVVHQPRDGGRIARVTDKQAMAGIAVRAEEPKIPWPGDRGAIAPHIWQIILGTWILFLLRGRVENEVDFWNLEARDFDVEADSDEMLQLDLENLLIPASFFGETIVGDDVGPPLILGQMFKEDGRDGSMSLPLRSLPPSMPGDDALFPIDQDGVDKAEPSQARPYHADLPVRMHAGVARVSAEFPNRQILDLHPGKLLLHGSPVA
jgi:hypothetical protein